MKEYPKRLIEVDLPIKRISEHARREKSIRHGHISTLHIWWARRPLAACRAVLCAALWPDPADPLCPQEFRDKASQLMTGFARKATSNKVLSQHCSEDIWKKWQTLARPENQLDHKSEAHLNVLRYSLLDFIADFANWDNSTQSDYLQVSRALTQAAHEALGGLPGTRPLIVDPFAGGGSIPLEALRVGGDVFASDLNPVAVLLNRVVLEYLPKYGERLADEVRKWGNWIREAAKKELSEFYPRDLDGATPIAYLWARTIKCEGPGCGTEVPMVRSFWLARRGNRQKMFIFIPDVKNRFIDIEIVEGIDGKWYGQDGKEIPAKSLSFEGNVKRGAVTCPVCGYTTPAEAAKNQIKALNGGAKKARLLVVITAKTGKKGRSYRQPTEADHLAIRNATLAFRAKEAESKKLLSFVPNEAYPDETGAGALSSSVLYGIKKWGDLFSERQLLANSTLVWLVNRLRHEFQDDLESDLSIAIQTILALIVDKVIQYNSSLCRWKPTGENLVDTFGRQALPMVWDFAETNILGGASGDFDSFVGWVEKMLRLTSKVVKDRHGTAYYGSALNSSLPDSGAQYFFTDPPYYDAIAYGDLSDYFYVWLRRSLLGVDDDLFQKDVVDKTDEIVQLSKRFRGPYLHKTKKYFERGMEKALSEGRRVIAPSGIGIVVFAHKSTSGWEAQLQAMVAAGWVVTSSWSIDTEMSTRMNAMETASLASSTHLVCRPRENFDGSLRQDVGDWRDVLQELPQRIHEWLPRIASEGIVGADAIFACLGPALEIFSRYARVEKASGEQVTLKEYLEHVWAAVAKQALNMIFSGADTTSFEEDARLTAMWLWTLSTDVNGKDENGKKVVKSTGYTLEYDAARKIAQGLGVHMEKLDHLVEIKGDKARLLPVAERTRYLFGKEDSPVSRRKRANSAQASLFESVKEGDEESNWQLEGAPSAGRTTLDKVHQCMILFAGGRSDALKRFLVEEGIGSDARFWQLAQSLSALYPSHSDEKRWVDGVMARKKSLGF